MIIANSSSSHAESIRSGGIAENHESVVGDYADCCEFSPDPNIAICSNCMPDRTFDRFGIDRGHIRRKERLSNHARVTCELIRYINDAIVRTNRAGRV